MALPPVLSEEALNRFRTKHCERLLVAGSCSFGDRCQYSHDRVWLRRNPKKHNYSAQSCSDMKYGFCADGENCKFAHSTDEELYHPLVYKSALCQLKETCGCYYCPFAHREAEVRKSLSDDFKSEAAADNSKDGGRGNGALQHRRRGARQSRQNGHELSGTASGQMLPQPQNSGDDICPEMSSGQGAFFRVDDFLQVAMQSGSETSLTGRYVPGLLQVKGSSSKEVIDCRVKLVSAGRKESLEAAKVVKEVRRWMNLPQERGRQRALDLRRTVATIYLAIPQDLQIEPALLVNGSIARDVLTSDDGVARQVASWVLQLVTEVQTMHADGIAHWCISPHNILVDSDASVCFGDFLGKIRALYLMSSGWSERSGAAEPMPSVKQAAPCEPQWGWAAWYPAEVHKTIEAVDLDGASSRQVNRSIVVDDLNPFAIDSWQLGVTIFYILTGEHMYGSLHNPKCVCENICSGRTVNLWRLDRLPLFKNFCEILTAREPEKRPSACAIKLHPLVWSLQDAAHFLETLPLQVASIITNQLPCSAICSDTKDDARLPESFLKLFIEHVMSQKDLSQLPWNSDEYYSFFTERRQRQRTRSPKDNLRTMSNCSTSSPSSDAGMSVLPPGSPFRLVDPLDKTSSSTSGYNIFSGSAFHMDPMEPAKVLDAFCGTIFDQAPDLCFSMEPRNIYTSSLFLRPLEGMDQVPVSSIRCMLESDSESLFHHFPFDFYQDGRYYSSI